MYVPLDIVIEHTWSCVLLLMRDIQCTLVLFVHLQLKYYPQLWTLVPTNELHFQCWRGHHFVSYFTSNLPPCRCRLHVEYKVNSTSNESTLIDFMHQKKNGCVPATVVLKWNATVTLVTLFIDSSCNSHYLAIHSVREMNNRWCWCSIQKY